MDQQGLVDALNEDLETEFQSIVQYIQHTALISGAEFLSIIDELKIHLTQELAHAQTLSEQIAFLGGMPTTDIPAVPSWSDSRSALEGDLQLETSQLERYRERFAQATELGFVDVAEALRPLLEQTQEHVRDLSTALGK